MPENLPATSASAAPHEGAAHEQACGCPQWLTGQKGSGKEALPEFSLISGDNPCQPVYLGWVVIALLLLLAIIGRFTMKRVPGKLQGLFEFTLDWVADITHQAMGPTGMAYFPMFVSFFLFILVGNLLGLIPGLASPTSAVNTTAALSVITFLSIHVLGMIKKGPLGYWGHFFHIIDSSQSKGLLKIIMMVVQYTMLPLIELIGEVARPLSLTMRLFGNIIAKETLLAVLFYMTAFFYFTGLMGVGHGVLGLINTALMFVPLILAPLILVLGVLVSLLQAIVFMALSMVYIAGATAEHE